MADPSIKKPYDVLKYMYFLWIGQILNILAVGLLKYSICALLLSLKFSRIYLTVIWASILMVTAFNMILPLMGCFCTTPFEANWNKTLKEKCFMKFGTGLTYSQVRSPSELHCIWPIDKEPGSC
jgi:putative Ca2+/H+ antiporter (TMEM165/GDT1 family)